MRDNFSDLFEDSSDTEEDAAEKTLSDALDNLKKYQWSHEYLGDKVIRRYDLQDRGSRNATQVQKLGRSSAYLLPAIPCLWSEVPIIGHAGKLLERIPRELMGLGPERAQQAKDLHDALEVLLPDTDEENLFYSAFKSEYKGWGSFIKDQDDLFKALFRSLYFPKKGSSSFFSREPTGAARWEVIEKMCGKGREDFKAEQASNPKTFKAALLTSFKEHSLKKAADIVKNRINKNGWTYGESKTLKPLAETALDAARAQQEMVLSRSNAADFNYT